MKRFVLRFLLLVLTSQISILLLSCDSGENENPKKNNKPVANAGISQTVKVNTAINLDGSASEDVDGDTLSYNWSIYEKPKNSSASFTKNTNQNSSFIPDSEGIYTVQLIVNDGELDSNPATVDIYVNNPGFDASLAPIYNKSIIDKTIGFTSIDIANDIIHVTYIENQGKINDFGKSDLKGGKPFYIQSTDGGETFSAPINLDTNALFSPMEFSNYASDVSASSSNVYFVYTHQENESSAKEIRFVSSIDNGATFSTPKTIATGFNWLQSIGFIRIVSSGNNVYVVYNMNGDVYCLHSSNTGLNFNPAIKVNSVITNSWLQVTDAKVDSEGILYILFQNWEEKGLPYIAKSTTNTILDFKPETKIIVKAITNEIWNPRIEINGSGAGATVFAVWNDLVNSTIDSKDNADIYFAVSLNGGDSFTDSIRLNDDPIDAVLKKHQSLPLIKFINNKLVVSWHDYRIDQDGGWDSNPNDYARVYAVSYDYGLTFSKTTELSNCRVSYIKEDNHNDQFEFSGYVPDIAADSNGNIYHVELEKIIKYNPLNDDNFVFADSSLEALTTNQRNIIGADTSDIKSLRGICMTSGIWLYPGSNNVQNILYMNQESDIENVASWGANVITFYINYFWFVGENAQEGWNFMDQVLNWCRKNNVYIIPSLSVMPVGGVRANGQFFLDEKAKEKVKQFWAAFALRYKDNHSELAGYDLLNEPYTNHAPFNEVVVPYYNELIDSIRNIDSNRTLYVETGSWGGINLHHIDRPNLVYNVHYYEPFGYTAAAFPWIDAGNVSTDFDYPGEIPHGTTQIATEDFDIENINNEWQQITKTVTIPALAEKAFVSFSGLDDAGKVYVDKVEYSINGGVTTPVLNGSFEEKLFEWEEKPLNWLIYDNAEISYDDVTLETDAKDGVYSISLEYGANFSNGPGWKGYRSGIDVVPGQTLTVSWWTKGTASKLRFQIVFSDIQTIYYDKNQIELDIDNDSDLSIEKFAATHNIPIFIGEAAPSLQCKRPGMLNFIDDLFTTFNEKGYSWVYYPYREIWQDTRYMGIYNATMGITTDGCYEETDVKNKVIEVINQ